MKEIFISVASYRDTELKYTLKSAVEMASQPSKLHFGIVYQGTDKDRPDFSFLPNYSLISMHPRDAKGAGYARSKAMSLYSDQEYYMQIDSHTQFVQNWDEKLVKQLKLAQSQTKYKAIISAYPLQYHREGSKIFLQTKSTKEFSANPNKQRVKLKKTNEWTSERIEFDDPKRKVPELSNTVLGGFIFTYGSIVKDVPYDPEISFFGEEICFSMRAWTRGYDIYSPTEVLLYHFYGRGGQPKIWKDDSIRKISWKEIQAASYEKQKKVLCGIEHGIFGAGNIRSLAEYEEFVGFDFKQFYGVE